MVRNVGGEAIEVIDAEASVYGKKWSKRFVITVKLYASFVALAVLRLKA